MRNWLLGLLVSLVVLPVYGQVTISGMALEDVTVTAAQTESGITYMNLAPSGQSPTQGTFGVTATADTCLCYLGATMEMDEISHVRIYVNVGTITESVEEIGIYSYDGDTQLFEGEIDLSGGDDVRQVANTLPSPPAVSQQNVWFCTAMDSTSAGWQLSKSNDGYASVGTRRFSDTCTDGEMPDTVDETGHGFVNANSPAWMLEDSN
jgi:hypothetical protein